MAAPFFSSFSKSALANRHMASSVHRDNRDSDVSPSDPERFHTG
jgi:hypothetical protein